MAAQRNKFKWIYIIGFIVFFILGLLCNYFLDKDMKKNADSREIVMNRITSEIERKLNVSFGENSDEDSVNAIIQEFIESDIKGQFKKNEVPYQTTFHIIRQEQNLGKVNTYGSDGIGFVYYQEQIYGMVLFNFAQQNFVLTRIVVLASLALTYLALILFIAVINKKIIKPFNELSDYPKRISKGGYVEKLPSDKNGYFSQFIWGINMLGDKIAGDKKKINKLISDRQTMLTTMAHGIKTPVANIKLYSSAIETGLYQPDGKPDENDSEIARKIDKNAEDILVLVKEMIETNSTGMVDFEPQIQKFYVKEFLGKIQEEYENRLKTLHIAFEIDKRTEALVSSDMQGLIRIFTQLIENAIKYGDGKLIKIVADKQDEGFFFSVINTGELLAEKEMPYVFNSFWRGSNSGEAEGSGIGLFESKVIANRLGGDVFVRRHIDSDSMEFIVFIP